MIRRLVHISDIHIPSDPEKHNALRDVFQNFFHLLDEVVSQESMILICGDLLHNKEIISPEQIMLARQFLEQCGKRCQTVLIAGNHDLNMFRKDRLDSLTPCCSGIPNVSYLSETGVRIFDNVAIVVNSLVLNSYNYETDTVDPLKSNDFLTHEAVSTSVQGYISVCLYHGIIDGSKAPNGYNLSSLTKKCHLQGFDYVLLGDVHRHQFLAPNIAYSGSLWQQNHGEDIGDHGMIIWDLEKRVGEFRRVPNPCAYYTYYFDKPFDKVVADLAGKNSVHVRLFFDPKKGSVLRTVASLKSGKHADVSTETRNELVEIQEIKEFLTEALKDVGIRVLTIKTICHGNTKKKGSFLITDHHLADRQIFLLQNYFLENPVDTDSESIKDVLQFHKVLLENSAESVPEGTQPFRNFNVRLLRFKNVFSFTENADPYSDGFHQIDFTKFEKGSVVGLLGSNFVGKSSIFDIILYALYEKCSRGKKSDVLSKGCRSFEIQLRFQVSGIPYEIWRRGVSSTSLGRASGDKMNYGSRFRERHEFDQPISWNGTDKKSNIIKKILCDYDEFIFSTFMLQNTPDNFLSDTAGERYKFFSKLLGFDHFDKQVALAKKMSLENTGAISQLERIIASSLKTLDGHVARIAQMSCAVSSVTVQEKIAALLKQKQKVMTDNSSLLNGRHSFVSVDQDFESFSSRFCDFKRDSLSFLQTLGLTLDALDQSHVSMTEHERHIEYCLEKVHKLRESKHQLSLDLCVLSQNVNESELYSLEMEGETLEADITDCIALLSEYESDKRKFECLSVEYMAIWSQITTWGQQEYPMKKRQRLSKDPETVSDHEKSDLFDPNCRYCRKNFDLDRRDELLQRLNFIETELRPLSQPPSAGNKLDFVFCHKAEYNALTERLSVLEKQKAVVKQQIGDIRSVVENRQRISWNKKVDQVILDVEEEIRQLEVDGEKGRHPHLQIALLKETYKSMKDEETMFHVISSLERYDKEITQLENLAESGQSLESLILQETVKRDQMQQLVKTYENEINELHKKARVISFYIEMFEVKLPNMLLLQSLPKIQEILNDMCSKIDLPFQYYIVADSLQGLYMTLNGLSFAMCSGFEQLVTSIFFRVALKIVGLSKSDVIFLDETFNCLDATHKRLLKPIFDLLCEHYDNLFVVSHDPDVKNFVQHSISVEKNRLTAPQ